MRFKHIHTLLLCLFGSANITFSQSSVISIEMDAFSHYLWRDDVNDFVVIQPSIDYSFPKSDPESPRPSLNMNLWLSANSDVEYSTSMESATTLYLQWITNDSLEFNTGLVHYSGHDSTLFFFDLPIHNWMELHTRFSAPKVFLSPCIEIYYHDMTGAYSTLGLSYSRKWNKATLNTSFLTGFRLASQKNNNGWREIGFSLGIPFHVKSFSFEVTLAHTRFPSQSIYRNFLGLNISLP